MQEEIIGSYGENTPVYTEIGSPVSIAAQPLSPGSLNLSPKN